MIERMNRPSNPAVGGAPAVVPTRRRFLLTGAALAAGGALTPWGSPVAWAEGTGAPVIDRIFPLRGAEGDTVIVIGKGFDPSAENNCIVLGDGLACVEVVAAAPNHLVGVIGPVAAAGSGPARVVLGRGRLLRDHAATHGGVTSVAKAARRFDPSNAVVAPVVFELERRSPFTVKGSLADGIEIRLGASSEICYRSARVDVWSPGGRSAHFELGLPAGGALTPTSYALHLADHINALGGGLVARADGDSLLVAQAGAGEGFAIVRSC